MNFLPEGIELMKTERPYWKTKDMKEGDNKLRIVMRPIAGWIDWDEKKPLRFRPENKPKKPLNPEKPVKPFWVCYVWDYAREGLYVIEFTQSSILKSLQAFGSDSDWGDFTKYDLKVKKEGSGLDTSYTVTPLPHKPMSENIEKALRETPVNLEALYDGGDPWNDFEAKEEASVIVLASGSVDELFELFELENIETNHLGEFLKNVAEKKSKDVSDMCCNLLKPQNAPLLAEVKKIYVKSLQVA